MKLALLADIHANLEALTACLADARAQGAEGYAFLGDLVGYGADPAPVLELVEDYVREGALVVRGNHDEAALQAPPEDMHPDAGRAIHWTRAQLSGRHLAFLSRLPLLEQREGAVFVHASAEAPQRWTYITDALSAAQSLQAAATPYVFCGHVHESVLYFVGAAQRMAAFYPVPGVSIPVPAHRRWLAIVGSVGQPRDGTTAARWALFDTVGATLTFFRVPYDFPAAAAKVRAAGLPEALARRLERGE